MEHHSSQPRYAWDKLDRRYLFNEMLHFLFKFKSFRALLTVLNLGQL